MVNFECLNLFGLNSIDFLILVIYQLEIVKLVHLYLSASKNIVLLPNHSV